MIRSATRSFGRLRLVVKIGADDGLPLFTVESHDAKIIDRVLEDDIVQDALRLPVVPATTNAVRRALLPATVSSPSEPADTLFTSVVGEGDGSFFIVSRNPRMFISRLDDEDDEEVVAFEIQSSHVEASVLGVCAQQ